MNLYFTKRFTLVFSKPRNIILSHCNHLSLGTCRLEQQQTRTIHKKKPSNRCIFNRCYTSSFEAAFLIKHTQTNSAPDWHTLTLPTYALTHEIYMAKNTTHWVRVELKRAIMMGADGGQCDNKPPSALKALERLNQARHNHQPYKLNFNVHITVQSQQQSSKQ